MIGTSELIVSKGKIDMVFPSPPVDIIRAMMIVWRIRWKIIRTVLHYVV